MTWIQKYRIRAYLNTCLWIGPALSVLGAVVARRIFIVLDATCQWNPFNATESGASAITGIIAGTMLTFLVFLLTMLLLAVQIASSQLTPRIIAGAFRDRVIRNCVSYFVFAFVFAAATQARIAQPVPELAVMFSIFLCILGMIMIFHAVDHMGKSLRPVSVVSAAAYAGIEVVQNVYPHLLDKDEPGKEWQHDDLQSKKPNRIVLYSGRGGVFLAFDAIGLAQLASDANCVICNVPAVGDYVAKGDTLFHVYGSKHAEISDDELHQHVAFGAERTMEQDPGFVFRVIVDVASRALSPAINDPTTAVMGIDQIHRLLLILGKRDLGDGKVRDAAGKLRLKFPTPNWEDFVTLGVTEIRLFGATSIQVLRRLHAMLIQLIEALPEYRHEPLKNQLLLLDEAATRNFTNELDRQAACTGDYQGMGGARTTPLTSQSNLVGK